MMVYRNLLKNAFNEVEMLVNDSEMPVNDGKMSI